MEEFKKELKKLLDEYNADIIVEADLDSFRSLRLIAGNQKSGIIDSGYGELELKSNI